MNGIVAHELNRPGIAGDSGASWVSRRRSVYRYYPNKLAQQIAAALLARGVELGEKQLRIIGRMLLETSDAAFDAALSRHGRVSGAVLDEIKLMHRSYLARYVD